MRRALARAGIGRDSQNVEQGQLWIISDACFNRTDESNMYSGSAIVTRLGNDDLYVETDVFRATSDDSFALQVHDPQGGKVCLFTELMIDGLKGLKSTIELHHKFAPAVTNHTLKKFLSKRTRELGSAYNHKIQPEIQTNILPPDNYLATNVGSDQEIGEFETRIRDVIANRIEAISSFDHETDDIAKIASFSKMVLQRAVARPRSPLSLTASDSKKKIGRVNSRRKIAPVSRRLAGLLRSLDPDRENEIGQYNLYSQAGNADSAPGRGVTCISV
jgi:hypothetical protein